MTDVEMEILEFLKQSRGAFFNRKEIARRARGRNEFEEDPHWAAAPLNSLLQQGLVEQNDSGHYRFNENPGRKERKD